MSPLPPIRREVLVPAPPATAFEVFTAGIGRWWPLAELGVFGAGATVAFVDGTIVERSAEGKTAVWGTVTRWDPPAAVAFTWHPGKDPKRASHVDISFTVADDGTLVVLQHSGWEVFAEPAVARDEYGQGWPGVLGHYRDAVDAHRS